jgi:hypothetical protein
MTAGSFESTSVSVEAHRPTRLPGRALALVVANATRMGLQLLLIPILARVIAPEAFGLVDLAAPIVVFISILAEAGLVTGLVRMRASLAAEQAAFWFSAAMGSACVAAAALLASPVGRAAHQPGLAPVLWTLSPALLLTCLSIVPSARLQRTGAFGAFAASELFACIAGAGVALWTAMHGWGAAPDVRLWGAGPRADSVRAAAGRQPAHLPVAQPGQYPDRLLHRPARAGFLRPRLPNDPGAGIRPGRLGSHRRDAGHRPRL